MLFRKFFSTPLYINGPYTYQLYHRRPAVYVYSRASNTYRNNTILSGFQYNIINIYINLYVCALVCIVNVSLLHCVYNILCTSARVFSQAASRRRTTTNQSLHSAHPTRQQYLL